MAVRITESNQRKLALLSVATDMSQTDIINLLIAAADTIIIEEVKTENAAAGVPKPKVIRIRRVANWVTKM